MEDKLLFILVYQKTKPLQTRHGLHFALRQPQTHYWMQHLLPVLHRALAALEGAPERDASRVAPSPLTVEGAPNWGIAGTERRRPRPPAARAQKEPYSGKQKAPTEKNLLLVNDNTGKVSSLGPTRAGKRHDTRAAAAAQSASPTTATLDKATGFQGSAPEGGLTTQPQKSPKAKT